jgi:hypothetical protein
VEYNNVEVAVIEVAVTEGFEMQVRELDDLQLAMVGGGAGEASFG